MVPSERSSLLTALEVEEYKLDIWGISPFLFLLRVVCCCLLRNASLRTNQLSFYTQIVGYLKEVL